MIKGLFITFEGGEGAGKSTLACRLRDALKADGHEVVFTREPGGTAFGEELRKMLLHYKADVASRAELFLFLSARIQHIEEVIKPAIKRGAIVLCDRFTDSTIAYQGEARGLGVDYVSSCSSLALGGFEPDLTFYVDIDPKQGLLRTLKRQSSEKFDRLENESLQFHEKVRRGFEKQAAAHPTRIITLDGTQNPDSLFQQAYPHIKNKLCAL